METVVEILETVVEILVHHWTANFSVGYFRLISAAAAAAVLCCVAAVLCCSAVLMYYCCAAAPDSSLLLLLLLATFCQFRKLVWLPPIWAISTSLLLTDFV